jgi:hypothetical protein
MYTKETIIKSLEEIANILGDKVRWVLAASGALFVHGIDILPNDIDIVVNKGEYDITKKLLKDYISSNTVDLLEFDINESDIEYKSVGSVKIPVNYLDIELEYYKQRKDKKDANEWKITLIKEELEKRKRNL